MLHEPTVHLQLLPNRGVLIVVPPEVAAAAVVTAAVVLPLPEVIVHQVVPEVQGRPLLPRHHQEEEDNRKLSTDLSINKKAI